MLNKKQQAFAEHYLQTFNASEAARRAGYSARSAASMGYDLLRIPEIRAYVDARLDELTMQSNEVLARLTSQARNEAADYLTVNENGLPSFDLAACIAAGKGYLVKGITYTNAGAAVIELYDGQKALELIGKYHGVFKGEESKMTIDLAEGAREILKRRLSDIAATGDEGEAAREPHG